MNKYSSIKTHSIKNGTITVCRVTAGTTVTLDSQLLDQPISCADNRAYNALSTLCDIVTQLTSEIYVFYNRVAAGAGFVNREAARKEYTRYCQLCTDVMEVRNLYEE